LCWLKEIMLILFPAIGKATVRRGGFSGTACTLSEAIDKVGKEVFGNPKCTIPLLLEVEREGDRSVTSTETQLASWLTATGNDISIICVVIRRLLVSFEKQDIDLCNQDSVDNHACSQPSCSDLIL
jgi:hypothetical protein